MYVLVVPVRVRSVAYTNNWRLMMTKYLDRCRRRICLAGCACFQPGDPAQRNEAVPFTAAIFIRSVHP
jgi:hypothetical protein